MKLLSLVATILVIITIANPLMAQEQMCSPRDDVIEQLAKKYQELPIALGVTATGGLIEILADIKSGTWTIIVTTPNGISCLVAAGDGWRDIRPVPIYPEA